MGAFLHLPKPVSELQIAWNSKFSGTPPLNPLRQVYSASHTHYLHWYSLRSQRSGQSQNVLWHVCNVSVFIWKQYPENFAFLILRILELFAVKFVNFSKSRLIFTLFYCFSMFVNKLFTYPRKRCFSVKSSTSYFQVKTKILADFEICISAPLRTRKNSKF